MFYMFVFVNFFVTRVIKRSYFVFLNLVGLTLSKKSKTLTYYFVIYFAQDKLL